MGGSWTSGFERDFFFFSILHQRRLRYLMPCCFFLNCSYRRMRDNGFASVATFLVHLLLKTVSSEFDYEC